MIRKPPANWQREESRAITAARAAAGIAQGGAKVVRRGSSFALGLFCYFFAALWGFSALAAGLAMPTL